MWSTGREARPNSWATFFNGPAKTGLHYFSADTGWQVLWAIMMDRERERERERVFWWIWKYDRWYAIKQRNQTKFENMKFGMPTKKPNQIWKHVDMPLYKETKPNLKKNKIPQLIYYKGESKVLQYFGSTWSTIWQLLMLLLSLWRWWTGL